MNRLLFDPEHLRIAAEVRAKAWLRRWLNLAGGLLVLLIMALGVVLALIVLARIVLHVRTQCDINTGTVILRTMLRVTPPSTNSRKREWP
jgi:hypothetical protein